MPGIQDLSVLLSSLNPKLEETLYTFATIKEMPQPLLETQIGQFRETEGITVICSQAEAIERALTHSGGFKKITLTVHSSLDAVGLTAAISNALAEAKIPCNTVAGFYHDHLFVPANLAPSAMNVLRSLAKQTDSKE